MKIAVVHNGDHDDVLCHWGRPCPERYNRDQVQAVADALAELGHHAVVLEGNATLPAALREFMPPPHVDGEPPGLVFNLAYGIQGEARYTHVPALLEMEGVPYTGSTPLGHAVALDKVTTKILLERAGLPTPRYTTIAPHETSQAVDNLRYPLIVKPRHESTSYGLHLVRNERELATAATVVHGEYEQAALVEEYIDGREICIGLLGNDAVECLPAVELDFGQRAMRLMTWDDKFHKRQDEPTKICPASLTPTLEQRLEELAVATFRACGLRDYARVDIRLDEAGEPFVLEINSMATLGGRGSLVRAASAAGYTFRQLMGRIVDISLARYAPQRRQVATATNGHEEIAKLAVARR